MTRTRTLRPCEAYAALAALLYVPADAERLADAGRLAAFPDGLPRQLAALLACYAPLVERDGPSWLFRGGAPRWQQLLATARDPRVLDAREAAPIRAALAGRVDAAELRELVSRLLRAPHAVAFDGRRLVVRLLAPPAKRRRLRVVDYVLRTSPARDGGAAA